MSKKLFAVVLSLLGLQATAKDVPTAKAECEEIMNALLPVAEQMLKEYGEFFPFGGAMQRNGGIAHISGYDGRERPPSKDIIELLRYGFREGARSGKYKATALVYDVRIVLPSTGKKSDAVAVALDHRAHYSVIVFFPYQLQNGEVVFGEVFAERGEGNVFAP